MRQNQKLRVYFSITLLLALLFIVKPSVDLSFSLKWFSPKTHSFIFHENTLLKIIDKSAYVLAFLFFCFHTKCLLYKQEYILNIQQLILGTERWQHKHALLLFCFGPVFTVQMFCKNLFGRARPETILEFGGTQVFSSAFCMTNECTFNCSFVSFHTAIATMLFLYVRNFCSGRTKLVKSLISLSLILFYAFIRIGQGKHFISDIIFSICFICIIDSFILVRSSKIHRLNYVCS